MRLSDQTDVCVVGAGAGGAVAAWALTTHGVRVTLLDRGPRFSPSSYYTHARDWEINPSPFQVVEEDPASVSYEAGTGEELDPEFAHLRMHTPSLAMVPPRSHRHPFHYSRALGVGGSTLHYQGEAHRFPAHAFRMRSERGVADDWPVGYEDLASYYDRVERLLGVAGDPDNPFKPRRGPYPYRAHPPSAASRCIARGARQIGLRVLPNPVAILPAPRPGRSACHYCNGCLRGCAVGAKGSVDVAVIPEAEATGRLQVVPRFQVTRLEHSGDGRVTAVVGFDGEGTERRLRARAVVLAAGAIETPRLLLASAGGVHPHGVGNSHGVVGRYLMEFLYVVRGGFFARPMRTYVGIPLDSRIWDGNGAVGSSPVPNGFVLGHWCGPYAGPAGTAVDGVEGFGMSHRAAMRESFGAGIELVGVAEQLPRPENRIDLSERRDHRGVPLARVRVRLDRTDLRALSLLWQRLGELAEASGVRRLVRQMSAYDVPNATHVAGTCRMGTDPTRSVVDPFGRVHGVPNLVIADASVLVTQGAGDSPSLTVQALALRAAAALVQRARRGEA